MPADDELQAEIRARRQTIQREVRSRATSQNRAGEEEEEEDEELEEETREEQEANAAQEQE